VSTFEGSLPSQVRIAGLLFWLYLSLAFVQFAEAVVTWGPYPGGPHQHLLIKGAAVLLIAWMIKGIWTRQKWCALVLVVLLLLNIAESIWTMPALMRNSIALGLTDLAKVTAAALGLILLLMPASRQWMSRQ
jgi:hypothetical protein